MTNRRRLQIGGGMLALVVAFVWFSSRPGDPVQVVVPTGSTLSDVADSLSSRGVIRFPTLFKGYARLRRAQRNLKAGTYAMETGTSWRAALRQVTRGQMVTVPFTIPEGLRLTEMAPRIAEVTEETEAGVLAVLQDTSLAEAMDVPGPGFEGYLFPDTYRFARGVPVRSVVSSMATRYRSMWTPERVARREALGMSEREIVTLASIVQAEARQVREMPRIAGVYHNRLQRGWRLEADPTVLYALGGYRARLLFAAIDSVENHPYNTYRQDGLPPGPIGAPGERALDAALSPEDHDYMFFVAYPDGSHVFTRSLAEHNAARAGATRARDSSRAGS